VVTGESVEKSRGYVDGFWENVCVKPYMAQILLFKNARVYIAARDENRAQRTIEELKEETGKQSIFFIKLDLADLPSVKAAVEEFTSKETKLHTLYNNALVLSRVYMGLGDLLAAEQRYHIPASGGVDQTGLRWAVRDERSR
jgi:NAD(P)-dependent dehydrogenase (short-subunit alcohol dehydrogenase family)